MTALAGAVTAAGRTRRTRQLGDGLQVVVAAEAKPAQHAAHALHLVPRLRQQTQKCQHMCAGWGKVYRHSAHTHRPHIHRSLRVPL